MNGPWNFYSYWKELRELFRLEICIPLKNLIIFRNMVVLKLWVIEYSGIVLCGGSIGAPFVLEIFILQILRE